MADVLLPSYEGLVSRWRSLSTSSREAHVNGFVLNYAYNSRKIENDAITYHDTHEVFESGRIIAFTGDVRTLFEIQNLKTSWEWARPLATPKLQLTEDLVLKAHELLTYGTYDEQRWESGERPGSYKLGDYVVGAKAVGADASDVPELMRDLLDDVSAYLSDDTRALTVAASERRAKATVPVHVTLCRGGGASGRVDRPSRPGRPVECYQPVRWEVHHG